MFLEAGTKNQCHECSNECLTCEIKDVCIKCKGQFREVKDGKCECTDGFEAREGDINCRKPGKPSLVVDPNVGEDDECIIIKKVKNERYYDFNSSVSLAQIA